MTEQPEVFEIDPNKKYILQVKAPIKREVVEKIKRAWEEWIRSSESLLILVDAGDVRLVKVETPVGLEVEAE